MRPATDLMPKALLPVLGEPFCKWQLELLSKRGVQEVIYSVGYKSQMLRDYVGDGSRWNLQVS
jgi:NDP-sugar pyrophosphorylase family protein